MKSHRPKSDTELPEMPLEDAPAEHTGATDFQSLMSAPVTERERPKAPAQKTDFRSLVGPNYGKVKYTERRSWNDLLIDVLSPLMVFVMIYSVLYFLLDVRYVLTAVHDANLRGVMLAFLVGVVALNRLVAREGAAGSCLYIAALGGATAFYTISAQVYDVGAFTGPWLDLTPGMATVLNLIVVAFLWWLVNRLTYECCLDEDDSAGDVGILTGTARRWQQRLKQDKSADPLFTGLFRKQDDEMFPTFVMEAYDPTEGPKKKKVVAQRAATAADRLGGRHPGMSIFYFSIPVLLAFALGLRLVQHGGERWIAAGQFYMGVYVFAALTLLMLTSLAQLRAYFRKRKVALPPGIGWFWLGLGFLMIGMVMAGASRLPGPPLPPIAHVEQHIPDPWARSSNFTLLVDARASEEILRQSRFMEQLGNVVLGIFALFVLYVALRGAGILAAALARRRHHYPRFVGRTFDLTEKALNAVTRLPRLPKRTRRRRIQRNIATSRNFSNSLSDAQTAQRPINDHVEHAYQALCALAYDLGVPRRPDQTPYEFIEAFPKELKGMREEALELTRLYVIAAYSPIPMDDKVQDRLRKFWTTYNRIRNRMVR